MDNELVSTLEGYAEREEAVGDAQQLECQLTLALLQCKRGEVSYQRYTFKLLIYSKWLVLYSCKYIGKYCLRLKKQCGAW